MARLPWRRRRRRRRAQLATLGLLAALVGVGLTPGVAAADPADGADALALRVAQLEAELAAPEATVAHAQALAAIALDDYQAKDADVRSAQQAATQAAGDADRAGTDLAAARADLRAFARRSYMSGSTSPGAASLLTFADPAQLTDRTVLLHAAGAYRADALGRFTAAQQQAQAARAAAQDALDRAADLERRAAAALATAQDAERIARRQAAEAGPGDGPLRAQLDQVCAQLVALVGEPEAQRRIARVQAAAAAVAAAGASATAGTTRRAGPPVAAAVAVAVAAARAELGVPYAWGGGGSLGPGYGIEPDAGVIGFDCSGLTQYAYAQAGVAIPRNSRAQFAQLPKVAAPDLQAGDLVFWAVDPADPATIHHVAIWLGDGRVLQAPESGGVVTVSAMWWAGYAGAVRPTG